VTRPVDFGPLESLHIADPEVLGPDCYGCPPRTPWPCDVVRLIGTARALRAALLRTDSRLSLLRHRGNIRWGVAGELGAIGSAYECDRILGIAESALRESEGLLSTEPVRGAKP